MLKKNAVIQLKTGLHARPAALFVQEANRYNCDIYLQKDEKKVNAKSIMGIMSLALNSGSEITLTTDGKDEEEAMDSLIAFISEDA